MSTVISNTFSDSTDQAGSGAMVVVSQSREIAEIQGAMTLAKRFPRNQKRALDNILLACQRPKLAEQATYEYAKGSSPVTGPTIRLAEAVAREWGNLQFGIRELEQRNGESTVEAYAIDLETNVRSSKIFQVSHARSTKSGSYAIKDPREIYELVANMGARRMRSCIIALVPGDVIDAAVEQCDATLTAQCDLSPENIKKMLDKFAKYGVNKEMIEGRIQRKLESITPGNFVALRKVYNSLEEGMSAPSDWFPIAEPKAGTQAVKKNAPIEPVSAPSPPPPSTGSSPEQPK